MVFAIQDLHKFLIKSLITFNIILLETH